MSEPISLESGLAYLEKGIKKLKKILESPDEPPFTSEDYMMLYTIVYNMCSKGYSQQLYEMYKMTFQEYNVSTILPSLEEKHGEYMLIELIKLWKNHNLMMTWMSRFFHYLDNNYISRISLPTLHQVGMYCFRDMVYSEINGRAKDAVLALIHAEREGGQIDRALVKNVLEIFVEIGIGKMDHYETDFEAFLLEDSASYYYQKAVNWTVEDPISDFMLMSEECLNNEKERISHYLHASSVEKLIERVQNQLLLAHALKLAYHYA